MARALIGLGGGEGTIADVSAVRFRDDFPMGEDPEIDAYRVTVDGVPLSCEIGGERHRKWIRLCTILDTRDLRLICAYTEAGPGRVLPGADTGGRSDAESLLVRQGMSVMRADKGMHRRTLREVLCVLWRWSPGGPGRGQVVVRPRLVDRHVSSDMTPRWVFETREAMLEEESAPSESGNLLFVRDSDLVSWAISHSRPWAAPGMKRPR